MNDLQKAAALEKLRGALYSGAKMITIDGQTVMFNSQADLKRSIRQLEQDLGGTRPRPSRRVLQMPRRLA
jgi:hypothetical protein